MQEILFRRSSSLVAYWTAEQLVFHNFATGTQVSGTALTIGLLDYFSTWKSCDALVAGSSLPADDLRQAVAALHSGSLLERSDQPLSPEEAAMASWQSWNPAAGFFHFSTKNVRFTTDAHEVNRVHVERAGAHAIPEATKHYPGVGIPLRRGSVEGSLHDALRRRRTWRHFGAAPVSLRDLGVVLELSFGVQHWMDLGVAGPAMLRTSPSAGARNPLEAYVIVRDVEGVAAGVYHYDPVGHILNALTAGPRPFADYLGGQHSYSAASMLVLITAVFGRTEWKYPFPRAYRTILLEAGHFAQTFCLVATALELAPFCTAALADSLIEGDLGIDGVNESVVYACGCGARPPGVDWAPWPDPADIPQLLPAGAHKTPNKP